MLSDTDFRELMTRRSRRNAESGFKWLFGSVRVARGPERPLLPEGSRTHFLTRRFDRTGGASASMPPRCAGSQCSASTSQASTATRSTPPRLPHSGSTTRRLHQSTGGGTSRRNPASADTRTCPSAWQRPGLFDMARHKKHVPMFCERRCGRRAR